MFFFPPSVIMSFLNTELFLNCFPWHLPIVFDSSLSCTDDAEGLQGLQVHWCSIFLCFKHPDHVSHFPNFLQDCRLGNEEDPESFIQVWVWNACWKEALLYFYLFPLSDRLFRFKCNSNFKFKYSNALRHLCFYTVLFQVQTMKLFSGAAPGAQELLPAHHPAPLASAPALLTRLRTSWASLKRTALIQLEFPSRSLRHRDKCLSWCT